MEVRRLKNIVGDTKTLSWRTTLNVGDLRKALLQLGDDLQTIGLPVVGDADLRNVLFGAFFANMKRYQAEPLISWCVGAAEREGLIRKTAHGVDRYVVVHN